MRGECGSSRKGAIVEKDGAVFGTFHFHVVFESGSEPVYPRYSQLPRKAYMGVGGGDRDQPRCDRMTTYSTLQNKHPPAKRVVFHMRA